MAVVGEAHVIVRAITTGFKQQVQNAVNNVNVTNAGAQIGQQLGRSVGIALANQLQGTTKAFRQLQTEATVAADVFKRLVIIGYFVGPALAGVAAAIGALATGLFVFASQVGAAIPSLIVLPGILASIAQAAIAVKIAFGGIGDAFKQLTKSSGGGSKAAAAATERIENAERSLARVIERNRETLIDSAKRLTRAENDLTDARERAREEIEQLKFDSEDAAISEQKAALALERAREKLLRVQDLPPNSRARREAELAFAEADLNLRRAIDRNADLRKAVTEADEKGVEGSDRVVRAKERLEDAEEAQARAVRNGLRAQEDAYRELEKAKKAAAEAGSGAGGEDAFKKLAPAAQEFVKYIVSLREQFAGLRKQIQQEFFPPFLEATKLLVNTYFPILEDYLTRTAKAAGNTAKKFAEIVTQQTFIANFKDVGETNIYVTERLGIAVGNLAAAFVALLDAAGPLIRRFTDWLVTLTEGWKESAELNNQTGRLTEIFNYAGDVAAALGDILRDLFSGIVNLGAAAAGPGSAGERLLTMLRDSSEGFRAWAEQVRNDDSLGGFFNRSVDSFWAVLGILKEIGTQLIRLAANEGMTDLLTKVREAIVNIGDALERVSGAGPIFGDFLVKFTGLLELFAESGGIQMFFGTLNKAMDVVSAIFSNEIVVKAFMFVAAFAGMAKALSVIGKIGNFAALVFKGILTKGFQVASLIPGIGAKAAAMGTTFASTNGIIGGLAAAFGIATGPMIAIIAAIAAVVAILLLAWENSEKFRNAVMGLVDAVKGALAEAFQRINEAIAEIMPAFDGISSIFKAIGDFLAVTFVPLLQVILVGAIKMVADKIVGFIRIVGGIIGIFKAVWDFIRGFFALLRGDTTKATELFRSAFKTLVDAIGRIFKGVTDILFAPFKLAFNMIAKGWNNTIGKLSWTVPRWVPGLGGNTISVPKIPELALGGVVYPSAGGALVRVAEAGRPERIEPLDEQGLSKRDRAIIAQLSGGGGGQTFNIYPSPGMDEQELAALVSRQIAFQLRVGAA